MTYRSATDKRRGPKFRFIVDTIAELKKVIWLTRREAAYLTALVLILSIIAGLVLGVIDHGFPKLIINVFLGG